MRGVDLRAAWHVARNDFRLLFRDRGTIFWSFVGPFLFMLFFGLLFRDSGDPAKQSLVIANLDPNPAFAQALAVLLTDEDVVVRTETALPDTVRDLTLVVPPGTADSLALGHMPALVLKSQSEDPTPSEQTLRAVAIRALLGAFLGLAPEDARASLTEADVRARVRMDPMVRMETRQLPYAEPASGFQHTVPAYLVMFLLMTLMTSGAEILISERKAGQLRRAQVSSTLPRDIVLGKFLSRFGFAWLQIVAMLGVGIGLFHIRMGAHPEALLLVLVAFAACATGLGLLFATLFHNPDKASGLGSLLTMAMAALGGCWWPLEIVPAWMRNLAFALPTGWGYDALNRVMALNATVPQIAAHLAVLGGAALVTLPLAVRRLARPV